MRLKLIAVLWLAGCSAPAEGPSKPAETIDAAAACEPAGVWKLDMPRDRKNPGDCPASWTGESDTATISGASVSFAASKGSGPLTVTGCSVARRFEGKTGDGTFAREDVWTVEGDALTGTTVFYFTPTGTPTCSYRMTVSGQRVQ